jgi:pilus assembly protein CpaE
MLAIIVSEQRAIIKQLKTALVANGAEFSNAPCLGVAQARSVLTRPTEAPDVMFVDIGTARDADAPAFTLLQQLRAATPTKLVAVGQNLSTDAVLRTVRSGAHDYLELGSEIDGDLASLIQRLRSEKAMASGRGRLISVAAARGGCGCSTIAVNLAAEISREHGRCGLLDLNLAGGDLATLLDLHPHHTLADLCQGGVEFDEAMFHQTLLQHESGIRLLASPPMLEHFGRITEQGIDNVLAAATRAFPYVVVDLEDVFHAEQVQAIRSSDVLVIALRLDLVSLLRTRKCLRYLEQLGIPMEKIRLVATHCERLRLASARRVREALGMRLTGCIPDDYAHIAMSITAGKPVTIDSPRAPASKAFVTLAKEIMQ